MLVVCQGTFYVLVNHLRLQDKAEMFLGALLWKGVKRAKAGGAGSEFCSLLTSTSSQLKKWMSGLCCSESWHTSRRMEE